MATKPGVPTVVPLQTPWNGYTPDLSVPARAVNGLVGCQSVVAFSGVLTIDHGWQQIEASTLPLGHTVGGFTYVDSGGNFYGNGVVGASPAQAQPIKHLASFHRFTASAGAGEAEIMAVTADRGGVAAFQETGHLFRLTSGAWTSVEFDSNDGAGLVVPSSVPLTGNTGTWVDSTVYSLGVTGGTVGAQTIQSVAESVFIFANYVDQVMYYPDTTGGSRYTDFRSYAEQIDDAGGAAPTYYSGLGSIFKTLVAKTVASFDGRVWYGNTVEGGAYHANRLRRSIIGNPFIVWPGFELENTPTTLNLNGVGAGYNDIEQFETPIQRILPLGDVLAVYSRDGIAFVRRTGNNAAPYAIQYITLDRGVLSPGSVVPISPAQHFAILSDGWYIINANGTVQELGLTSPGTIFTGRTGEANYKWKSNFYSRLNQDATVNGVIQLGYDSDEQFVRISTATTDNTTSFIDATATIWPTANEVWIYDIKNDRVWLDNYTVVGDRDESPTVWANAVAQVGDVLTWAEVTAAAAGPWSAIVDAGSWAGISPDFGGSLVLHGDLNGYVYGHSKSLTTRDGDEVDWSFTATPHNLRAAGGGERLVQRVDIQYENNESSTLDAISVTVNGYTNDSGTSTTAVYGETNTINLQRGNSGEIGQDYSHFKVVGDHHQVELTGTGKMLIHSIDLEFQILQGRYRRREGT